MGFTIPPTTKLSSQLFGRLDANSGLSPAVTEEEKLCIGELFHTTVSRHLFQDAPYLDLAVIDTTIKILLVLNHVNNEDGILTLVPTDDLPDKSSEPKGSL